MTAPERWRIALLGCLLCCGCAESRSPVAGGARGEDAILIALLDAAEAGDCPEVVSLAARFSTRRPARLDRVNFAVGRCLYADGQLEAAATLFERVRRVPTESVTREALYFAGRARYRLRAFEVALDHFEALLGCCAGNRRDNATYFRARALYRLDRLTEARLGFADLLGLPDAAPSYRARALYYTGKTHYAEGLALSGEEANAAFAAARRWFAQVLADFPEATIADDAAYALGKAWFRADEFAAAAERFAEVLERHPTGSVAHRADYYLGRALAELGRYDEAAARLRGFDLRWPQSSFRDNARYHLGRTLYRWGVADPGVAAARLGEAHGVLIGLTEAFPESFYVPGARYFGARALYRLDRRAEALPLFEQVAMHAESGYADNARYYAGLSAYHLGVQQGSAARWEAAVGHFAQLAADHPESSYRAGGAYFGGRALTRLGRLAEADVMFGFVIDERPDSAYLDNALRRRVEVRAALGDCAGAAAALEMMRRLVPESAELPPAAAALADRC